LYFCRKICTKFAKITTNPPKYGTSKCQNIISIPIEWTKCTPNSTSLSKALQIRTFIFGSCGQKATIFTAGNGKNPTGIGGERPAQFSADPKATKEGDNLGWNKPVGAIFDRNHRNID
jgi:hypothetical protein